MINLKIQSLKSFWLQKIFKWNKQNFIKHFHRCWCLNEVTTTQKIQQLRNCLFFLTMKTTNNQLSELTNEELLKKKKTTKFVMGLLLGALTCLVVLNFVNIFNGVQKWSVLGIPLALLPIVLVIYNSNKEIDKELKSRNLQ